MNLRTCSDAPCLESAGGPLVGMTALTAQKRSICFGIVSGAVIVGQTCRIVPFSAEAWQAKKALFDERTGRTWPNAQVSTSQITREYEIKQFWQFFADARVERDNAIETEAGFSCAIAVMDKIEGWEEECWVRSKFETGMWIHTKAVTCNGRIQDANIEIHHGGMELDVR